MNFCWAEEYSMVKTCEKQESHLCDIVAALEYFYLAHNKDEPSQFFHRLCRRNVPGPDKNSIITQKFTGKNRNKLS